MSYSDRKAYMQKYQREWVAKRRHSFFKDKKCALCESTEKLVLHHINPKEKESHNIWSWSEERRLKEIVKCIVWCESCHIEYHAKEMRIEVHGFDNMYNKGCRCDLCRDFKSKKNKRFRK